MASARYTLNITEEDLKPDIPPELSPEEKRANWLHYNKWWIIGAALLALLAAWLIHDVVTQEVPDVNIALVSTAYLSDETITSLEEQLAPHFSDLDGDGQVFVNIVHYYINLENRELNAELDAELKMTAELQLTTDIQTSNSLIYITDGFRGLQDYAPLFAHLDDPYSYPEDRTEYDKMAFRWGDSALLNSIQLEGQTTDPATGEIIDIQDLFADFDVAMRTLYDDENEELLAAFADSAAFMKKARPQ